MLIWWWGAIILGGMLTESPPSSQRLITSAPPAVFFVALAVWKIGQIAERVFQIRGARTPALAAASSTPARSQIRRYLLPALGAALDRRAVLAQRQLVLCGIHAPARLRQLHGASPPTCWCATRRKTSIRPIAWCSLARRKCTSTSARSNYLLPDIAGQDIPEPLTAPFDPKTLPDDKQPVFIFMPFRRNELAFVQQTYPNGRVEELPSPIPGATEPLLVYVYRVAK